MGRDDLADRDGIVTAFHTGEPRMRRTGRPSAARRAEAKPVG
ncbi:hypothetical protein ACQPXS_05490 [Streptomyces sp. CA-142005]